MKQQQKTNRFGTAAKVISIILLIVSCLAAAGSFFGIVLAYSSDFYSPSGESDLIHSQPLQNAVQNAVYDDIDTYLSFLHLLRSQDDYYYRRQAAAYESKLSQKNSNVLFKITDSQGNQVASNTDGELDSLSLAEAFFEYSTEGEAVSSTYYFINYDDAAKFIDSLVDTKWYDYSVSGPYSCGGEQNDEQETEQELEYSNVHESVYESVSDSAHSGVTDPTESSTESATKSATESSAAESVDSEPIIFYEQNDLTKYYVTVNSVQISYETYKVSASINPSLPASDHISSLVSLMSFVNVMKYHFIYIFFAALLISLALTIFLCSAAGRHKGETGARANLIDKIPFDLLTAAYFFIASLIVVFISETGYRYYYSYYSITLEIILLTIALLIMGSVLLSFILTLATRVKLGRWWQNTILYRLYAIVKKYCLIFFAFVGRCVRDLPSLAKGLIFFAAIFVTDMLVIGSDSGLSFTVWFARTALLLALVLMVSVELSALRKGGKKISDGDLDSKIDTKNLHGSYKEIGESFNSIGEGLSKAVQEQTKSERMKTELITNVSHDIKTPLTCIINYVDLLKKESLGSEAAKEYVEILDRQSMRLKKLTEDLIEASKASTGNISVDLSDVNISLLLSQAVGEYEEKLTARNVSIINDCKSENAMVRCDGRLLWRVFDNLFSNILKYTQEGTRVYITTEAEGGKVKITFKNISGYQLNISPDELTERFVRGDSSRNTEGSGLGLSIAKSLTELQGGSFYIDIDGDLFKTVIVFDMIQS